VGLQQSPKLDGRPLIFNPASLPEINVKKCRVALSVWHLTIFVVHYCFMFSFLLLSAGNGPITVVDRRIVARGAHQDGQFRCLNGSFSEFGARIDLFYISFAKLYINCGASAFAAVSLVASSFSRSLEAPLFPLPMFC